MTVGGSLTIKGLAETVKAITILVVAFTAVLSATITVGWYVVEPRVEPYLKAINLVPDLAARVERMEGQIRPIPVVEFEGDARVRTPIVSPGGKLRITYILRRNIDCPTEVHARWYSEDYDAFDTTLERVFSAVRVGVTKEMHPNTFTIAVPDNITPGFWAYDPTMSFSGACAGEPVVSVPPAYFQVVEEGE